ncbi:MAG: hypothetical protein EOL87_18530 [Spartobacteria bacterium]|nr:hypothetical protein [Spartobacteria bacterium]
MNPQPLFSLLASKDIASFIKTAKHSVCYVAPGIQEEPAQVLSQLVAKIGPEMVTVCLDFNERTLRMGYGSLQAVEELRGAGIAVRSAPGMRTAFIIVDREGYMFTPTALLLEAEPEKNPSPNAMYLSSEQVTEILARFSPLEKALAKANAETPEQKARIDAIPDAVTPETIQNDPLAAFKPAPMVLESQPVQDEAVVKIKKQLEQAPPAKFDVARQVRVYSAYLQYVELSLRGAAIQRHKVQIPKILQGLGNNRQLENRLKTTFDLIDKDSDVSSKPLQDELNNIRKNFTKSLGNDKGRVILKSSICVFEEIIKEFQKKIENHKDSIKLNIKEHINRSKYIVTEHYIENLLKNPPVELKAFCQSSIPTRERSMDWLDRELTKVFPKVEDICNEIALDLNYKDVTYQTLKDESFLQQIRELYPDVDWDRPFEEYKAAGEV